MGTLTYEMNIASNLKVTFDTFKQYFPNFGYQVENSSFPSTLVISKKGDNKTKELNESDHEITFHFNEVNNERTIVSCLFKFPGIFFIGKDTERRLKPFQPLLLSLQNEIKFYSNHLPQDNNKDKEFVQREKIIERQIVKVRCRYCGSLNNDGVSACEACGARL